MSPVQAQETKLVGLEIVETSGVDHPAHLHEGWVVMKSSDLSATEALLGELVNAIRPAGEAPMTETTVDTRDAQIAELQKQIEGLTATIAIAAAPAPEPTLDELMKSVPEPVRKALEERDAKIAAAEADASKNRELLAKAATAAADAQWVAKAQGWSNLTLDASVTGPLLRQLNESAPELATAIIASLDGANTVAGSGELFKEVGTAGTPGGTDAWGQIETIAKAKIAAGDAKSMAEAVSKAVEENDGLYKAYLAEKR